MASDSIRQGVPRMPSHPHPADRDNNTRLELPKRAHTFQNGTAHQAELDDAAPDAFDTAEYSENEDNTETARPSVELDELPIELITLTDRYGNTSATFLALYFSVKPHLLTLRPLAS